MPDILTGPIKSPLERSTAGERAAKASAGLANNKDENANGQLNNPEVNEAGQPTQRAITTPKQAWSIAKGLRDRAKDGRIKKAALVASKYNGDPPFTQSELRATGQGWRNNFSTNFLGSIVDRVTPQITDPVHKADLLTHSALPSEFNEGPAKSRKFCEIITKTIRAWPKWKDLLSGLSKEIVLYGNACPARIDRNWRPRLWGFGECFLPEGTGQHANDVQVAVFWQPLLLHEFIKLFKDKEVAKRANFNLETCREIANRKTGQSEGDKDPTALDQQDSIREGGGVMGWSYQNQNKTVNLFHVLVRDYTGEVDLWTVDADQGLEVRHELGLHGDILEALTLFTFESGNRKYYGSKGLGRKEANLHTAIERGRNLGWDQMYLSGLLIFEGDPKDASSIQSKVLHPFVVVNNGKIVQEQIQFNHEAHLAMDGKLVEIAESIAGAFIPPNLEGGGSSNTKIEAAQKAERELAVKEGVLGRFFDHLSELVQMMQKGICSPENIREAYRIWKMKKESLEGKGIRLISRKVWDILKKAAIKLDLVAPAPAVVAADEEAVQAIIQMLDAGLSPEEIVTLSMQPAGSNSQDEGTEKDNRTLQWIMNNRDNPLVNQRVATEMDARIAIGEDRAKAIIIAEDDPNVKAKATRDQIIELSEMMDGNDMPVAGFDNHVIHREVLGPRIGDLVHAMEQAPSVGLIKPLQLAISHYLAHMQLDTITPDDAKKEEANVMQGWKAVVDKAANLLEKQAQQLAAQGIASGPDGMPIPVQGQPVQVGPNGQMIGEGGGVTVDHQLKAAESEEKYQLAKGEQELRARELTLKEKQHDHQVTKDALTLQQGNVQMVAQAAKEAQEQGNKEADRELQEQMMKENAKRKASGQ